MAKPIHGAPKPKDVPEDMQDTPPIPCDLRAGDPVIYTNDYGVKFNKTVRGFAKKPHGDRYVYVFTDAWWFPVSPDTLQK